MNYNRILRPRFAWIFVGLLMLLSLISHSGIKYLIELRMNMAQTKKDIQEINKENIEYEAKIKETRDNPKAMETLARTKLGMVKPDETVYELK